MITIKDFLMARDGLTEEQADELVAEASAEAVSLAQQGEKLLLVEVPEKYFGIDLRSFPGVLYELL